MICTYGMLYRPPGFSTCPKGFVAFNDHPKFRYGTVDYDRELSDDECRAFEMVRVRSEGESSGVVSRYYATEEKMGDLYFAARAMLDEFPEEFDSWIGSKATYIKDMTGSQESYLQIGEELKRFIKNGLDD